MQKLLKSIFFAGFVILLNLYPNAQSESTEIEILSRKKTQLIHFKGVKNLPLKLKKKLKKT